jgi:hypothetical protein
VETHFAAPPAQPVYRGKKRLLIPALAGLEAGILGVIWMFVCFFIAAFWGGSGLWSIPNLFSTMFYGDYVYQDEFFHTTWAGLATIIVIYTVLGIVWGCVWGERRRPLLAFSGALTGLLIYFLFFNFIWVHLAPSIVLYAPTRQLQVAHILWGAVLAKSPAFAARISAATSTAVPPNFTAPGPDQAPAEVVTGELIQ